ncbi:MAG: ABC transporter substrate-binding protein [Puia sp.]|nr:ABC transporter substrate-binding protein [Puia sp.]
MTRSRMHLRPFRCFSLAALATGFLLASCVGNGPKDRAGTNPVTDSPTKDTTSSEAVVKYAQGFSIDYHDHYKLVKVLNRLAGKPDTLEYVLVQRGFSAPAGYPKAQVIHIPVRSIIGMSSMHVALADFVGIPDRITGLGSLQYISSPSVRRNIKAGKVAEVGLDGNLNNELILTMRPDILIVMSNPENVSGGYKTLTDAGIPVLPDGEWLESNPLGRTEWVKLMAALVNKEAYVNAKFDSVSHTYDSLAQLAARTSVRPHVIVGLPFKGSWFVPAGESYMAQFLRDAGAGYKWYDTKGIGSISLNFESVAPEALTADYWLNIGSADTKADILAKDKRYSSFKAFKTGDVYNNNKRVNDLGSNDYWESGGVNPQLILADLIRILHPELLPDHQLIYYKQLN